MQNCEKINRGRIWKKQNSREKIIWKKYFWNSNKKTQNICLKDNCMDHTFKKIQSKKTIWWFIVNFSVEQTKSVSGQHAPTFDLSCNQRLNLAQSLKIKIQWCCYSSNKYQDHYKLKVITQSKLTRVVSQELFLFSHIDSLKNLMMLS